MVNDADLEKRINAITDSRQLRFSEFIMFQPENVCADKQDEIDKKLYKHYLNVQVAYIKYLATEITNTLKKAPYESNFMVDPIAPAFFKAVSSHLFCDFRKYFSNLRYYDDHKLFKASEWRKNPTLEETIPTYLDENADKEFLKDFYRKTRLFIEGMAKYFHYAMTYAMHTEEIDRLKYCESEILGYDIGLKKAIAVYIMYNKNKETIDKAKWIASENAGRNIGIVKSVDTFLEHSSD